MGRGNGVEGFWYSEEKIKSDFRLRDRFLEFLRAHVRNEVLTGLSLDSEDRIVELSFLSKSKLLLFFKARDLYFSYIKEGHDTSKAFYSWKKVDEIEKMDNYFSVFDEIGRTSLDKNGEAKKITDVISLLTKNEPLELNPTKKKKFLSRKQKNILADLENVRCVNKLKDLTSLPDEEISKLDSRLEINSKIKVKLDSENPHHRRDILFLKIKKLNKAKGILEKRLLDTQNEISQLKSMSVVTKRRPVAPFWKHLKSEKTEQNKDVSDLFVVYDFEHYKIAVGKTARGNDEIRKSFGKSSDIWMHIENATSSHAILKLKSSNHTIGINDYKEMASLICKHSQWNSSEVSVIYSNLKNIKAVKGSPGKVIYKKERYLKIFLES